MVLIGADVDHMWRYELADNAFNRDLESAFGKQRQVIELVRVAVLDVASAPKVHHARVEVGDAADLDDGLAHGFVTGMPVPVDALGETGQMICSGKPVWLGTSRSS